MGYPGTLCKNSGNGSFADFLAAISVNFIESGARQNRARFWQYSRPDPIRPDQSGSGPINWDRARPDPTRPDQTRSDPIRPDRESILAILPIEDRILVMRRSATMLKNSVLLMRRACPDEPDDGKYEFYYVSYSY
jgi:hypothetical protein